MRKLTAKSSYKGCSVNVKRWISAALIYLVAISIIPPVFAANSLNMPETTDSAEFLKRIGVIQSYDETSLSGSVTRADFAVYAARAIKVNEFEDTHNRYFIDLPMESYATASVNALVDNGAIAVGDDRSFRPDDIVTYAEALKIMLSLMGYDELAKYRGGFPYGYLSVASNIGIGVSGAEQGVTLGGAMRIIYDCMSKNIYDIESVTADGEHAYTNRTGRTLLSIYYSLYREEGVLTSADGASIDGEYSDVGFAKIGGTTYKTDGFEGAYEYLGEKVTFVYKKLGDDTPILFFIENGRDSKDMLEISVEDYDGYDGEKVYYYSDENKSRRKNISTVGMKIVYNGEPADSDLNEVLNNLSEGYIRFTDTDSDDNYDCMIITDYKNFVVKSMTNGKTLLYNDLQADSLDLSQYVSVIVKNSEGSVIESSDIMTGSILSVAASKNKNIIKIIMSESVAEGMVTAKETEDGTSVFTVNDKKYAVSKGLSNRNTDDVMISRKYVLRLNAFGKIVSADSAEQTLRLGYLCDIRSADSLFDEALIFKIYTSDGKLSVFDGAASIMLDDTKYKSEDLGELVNNIPDCSVSGGNYTVTPQIILYKTDSDGKINVIDTHNTAGGELVRTTDGVETLTKYNTRFGKKVIFSSAAKIYKVPNDNVIGAAAEDDFSIGKTADFYRSLAYPIEAYKLNKDDEYDDIIVYRTNDSVTEGHDWANSNMIMIDSVCDSVNSDGETVKEIRGIVSGNTVNYIVSDNVKSESFPVNELHCGDLIRVRVNLKDEVSVIQLLYCAETNTRNNWATEDSAGMYFDSSFGANFQLSFGYVYDRGKNVISWGSEIGKEATEAHDITYLPVMVYDASRRSGKVYKGTIDDIADFNSVGPACDTVILQSTEGAGKALAVFKR